MEPWMSEYKRWLDNPAVSEDEWKELDAIRGNEKEIKERFYAPLAFGTGGLRGIMGAGINRMNIHMIRLATQAFAQLIVEEGPEACRKGICIDFDCRNHSEEFAREAACVCAANGIHVRIFDALRPTPELSFSVIFYEATAGLNITASHNPKAYNGYKVYWSDGAQLPPEHADIVAKNMEKIDMFNDIKIIPFEEGLKNGIIEFIGEETDKAFMKNVMEQRIDPDIIRKVAGNLNIVYTPFHGCGYKLVPEALDRSGVIHLYPVEAQMVIDGNFPTVESPNPENPEGFYLAVDIAKKVKADLILGTDPDSDRVGVLVPDKNGEYVPITGNQMGALLMDYEITARERTGRMPKNPAIVSTIVSTGFAKAICQKKQIHFDETFTGFKFIAEKLAQYKKEGSYQYLMGFEESYGYMMGDYVRDKDAVTASMMVVEMTAYYRSQGMSLLDAIEELYQKYGFYMEKTVNIFMEGLEGAENMKALMNSLRSDMPENIGGRRVLRMRDYLTGDIQVPGLGCVERTEISGSNVLYFELEDGTDFVVRPSGTEPKIKIYVLAHGEDKASCLAAIEDCVAYAQQMGK